MTAALKSFSNLPLGARIRYPGNPRVYTIIDQCRSHEGEPLRGKVADWEPDMLGKVGETFDPARPHAGCWHGQGVYSHIPVECGGDCPDMVEAVD